ncbi:hypothetical protein [Streptomyces sp. NPDC093568]|uniref:hypothetical protein n=1 Tax=Streptomyces sp. NPDC093568 TaxID=3366041 RepID=UPI0037FA09E8
MAVLVSSDTDIYISPGLYGDCLPTSATGRAADSFRAGHVNCLCLTLGAFTLGALTLVAFMLVVIVLVVFMLAHAWQSGQRPVDNLTTPADTPVTRIDVQVSGFTSHRHDGHRQTDVNQL